MKKKLGIGCLSVIGIALLITIIFYVMKNESLPVGKAGPEAEALAQKMLTRLNKPAWDSLNYISWTFTGRHHYAWDKVANHAIIKWDDKKVLMNLDEVTGRAYAGEQELIEDEAQELISTAWNYWCNDSFWLAAPYKATDPGTARSIITMDDGSEALLVTYDGGGVTPGDSYLWLLDNTGLPEAYKMWVQIIPLGGTKVEWNDWKTLPGGAMVAQNHPILFTNIAITNLKAGQSISDLGLDDDAFSI